MCHRLAGQAALAVTCVQSAPLGLVHTSLCHEFVGESKPPVKTMTVSKTTTAWPKRALQPADEVTSVQVAPSLVDHTSLKALKDVASFLPPMRYMTLPRTAERCQLLISQGADDNTFVQVRASVLVHTSFMLYFAYWLVGRGP